MKSVFRRPGLEISQSNSKISHLLPQEKIGFASFSVLFLKISPVLHPCSFFNSHRHYWGAVQFSQILAQFCREFISMEPHWLLPFWPFLVAKGLQAGGSNDFIHHFHNEIGPSGTAWNPASFVWRFNEQLSESRGLPS
ncbi:hypothetical protein AVEN_21836-1 [Araneus ventricosus]|uniref:Uncharacterized protein n=1 Tax=Araneus ventricosus TaxID=182803 RepID=A0A4Y2RW26_ARAVE|nr:hypothetical protein AVEN_21836-1 [Araneus ventricosus]